MAYYRFITILTNITGLLPINYRISVISFIIDKLPALLPINYWYCRYYRLITDSGNKEGGGFNIDFYFKNAYYGTQNKNRLWQKKQNYIS